MALSNELLQNISAEQIEVCYKSCFRTIAKVFSPKGSERIQKAEVGSADARNMLWCGREGRLRDARLSSAYLVSSVSRVPTQILFFTISPHKELSV
eukprot:4382472-Amphidinium_carterae.2